MSKKAEFSNPFEVVITADVFSTEEHVYTPSMAKCERWSMEGAVGHALDHFRMQNSSKTVKIHKVTVTPAQSGQAVE